MLRTLLASPAKRLALSLLIAACDGSSSSSDAGARGPGDRDMDANEGSDGGRGDGDGNGDGDDGPDGGKDSGTDSPSTDWRAANGTLALTSLCSEFTAVYCAGVEKCCTTRDTATCMFGTIDTCVDDFRRFMPEVSGLVYDGARAATWLREVEGEMKACGKFTRAPVFEMFKATKKPGDDCFGMECDPQLGGCKRFSADPTGKCIARNGEGESCGVDTQCTPDVVCNYDKRKCVGFHSAAAGAECWGEEECPKGMACRSDTGGKSRCQAKLANGKLCNNNWDCVSSLCKGVCVACSESTDCFCDEVNESVCYGCAPDGACHLVQNGVGVAANGTPCADHPACQSGMCFRTGSNSGECRAFDPNYMYCGSPAIVTDISH